MEILIAQTDPVWEDPAANLARVRETLAHSRVVPGSLLVLPEMFATGFTMKVETAAEAQAAGVEDFLRDLARRYKITVLGGVSRRLVCGKGANEAVVFGPNGEEICRYRKTHPFSPSGEAEAFETGDTVSVFPWNGFTVAPLICYDLRFPELFRSAVDLGADCFAVIASWPTARQEHWTTLLRARAIENQAAVIGANRCGADPKFAYRGGSLILDALGATVAEAGDAPAVLRATLSAADVLAWRAAFPALRDRRTAPLFRK